MIRQKVSGGFKGELGTPISRNPGSLHWEIRPGTMNWRPCRSNFFYCRNIFTGICQSFYSQGGGGCLPQGMLGYTLRQVHPPGRVHPLAGTWQVHPPGSTPPGKHTPPRSTTPDSHCSRRYASYWNAFLLSWSFWQNIFIKKECIPVGCLLPTHWPYAGVCFLGGVSGPGGCLLLVECLLQGGGVCSGGLLQGGGCLLWGVCSRGVSALGVSAPGGVCSQGGCLLPGGVCSREGCLLLGGGIPACTEADTPPVDRITDTSKNITLTTTSLRPVIRGWCFLLWDWPTLGNPGSATESSFACCKLNSTGERLTDTVQSKKLIIDV